MKRTVPASVAIASGFLGVLLGICFSIIIVITNPDGTKTFLQLADGSQVEMREGNSNALTGISEAAALNDNIVGRTDIETCWATK